MSDTALLLLRVHVNVLHRKSFRRFSRNRFPVDGRDFCVFYHISGDAFCCFLLNHHTGEHELQQRHCLALCVEKFVKIPLTVFASEGLKSDYFVFDPLSVREGTRISVTD